MTSIPNVKQIQRTGFLLRVRPERLPEYLKAHEHVWPDMLKALHNTGWRNYSLFLEEETGTVFGYFESENIQNSYAAMSETEVNEKWQQEMAPFFQEPDGGNNQTLKHYFYLP